MLPLTGIASLAPAAILASSAASVLVLSLFTAPLTGSAPLFFLLFFLLLTMLLLLLSLILRIRLGPSVT